MSDKTSESCRAAIDFQKIIDFVSSCQNVASTEHTLS